MNRFFTLTKAIHCSLGVVDSEYRIFESMINYLLTFVYNRYLN